MLIKKSRKNILHEKSFDFTRVIMKYKIKKLFTLECQKRPEIILSRLVRIGPHHKKTIDVYPDGPTFLLNNTTLYCLLVCKQNKGEHRATACPLIPLLLIQFSGP